MWQCRLRRDPSLSSDDDILGDIRRRPSARRLRRAQHPVSRPSPLASDWDGAEAVL